MERTAGAIPPPVDHRRQSRQREQAEILFERDCHLTGFASCLTAACILAQHSLGCPPYIPAVEQ